MSVKRIIALAKQFTSGIIGQVDSNEFHALINPILFDADAEFERKYNELMTALDDEEPALKAVLILMLTFFAERKEFLVKRIGDTSTPTPTNSDTIYSYLCAIPILFDKTEINPIKFSVHDVLANSYTFLDEYSLLLCDTLVSYDLLKLNPRELSLLHDSIFKDEAFTPELQTPYTLLEQTISQLDQPSVFEHKDPKHLASVKFIIGALVSNTPIENESYLFEMNKELQHMQKAIELKFSETFHTKSTVLPLNYLTESFKVGLLSQQKTNIIRNIQAFRKTIDNVDNISIFTGYNSETRQLEVVAKLSAIPVLMFSTPLLDPSKDVADNLEELDSFFRHQGFKHIDYLT